MKTVYVVTGIRGEYSDTNWWTVKVFASKASAEAYVRHLEAQLPALYEKWNKAGCQDSKLVVDEIRELDPGHPDWVSLYDPAEYEVREMLFVEDTEA